MVIDITTKEKNMTMRIMRIYNGSRDSLKTNVIGLNARAMPIAEAPAFADFMDQRGYTWQPLRYEEQIPADSVSWGHVEVSPALQAAHIQELGELCVGRADRQPAARSNRNEAEALIIVDNRQPVSQRTFGPHVFVAGV